MSDPAEKWPTFRQRCVMTQSGRPWRPTNEWCAGDLPAPWAEADVVRLGEETNDRMPPDGPGLYVITYATSVDYGDAWYFRIERFRGSGEGSGRLHVANAARSSRSWAGDGGCDYMAPLTLVDTCDPHGLTLRNLMIEQGWTQPPGPDDCPRCNPDPIVAP